MLARIRTQCLAWTRERRRAALLLGAALAAGGALVVWRGAQAQPSAAGEPAPAAEAIDIAPAPTVLIFVSGAVAHPGLYHLTSNARVADALAAAGGVTADADPSRLPNESSRVHDGRQVNVPFLRSGGSGGRSTIAKLDLNSASVDELRALPEMPPGAAEAIIEHRSRWGSFTSVSELKNALGLDRATVTALARELKVSKPP